MKKILSGIVSLLREIREGDRRHRLSVYAASSSFYLFLSLVPFLLLAVQLLRYLPAGEAERLPMGELVPEYAVRLIAFLMEEIKGNMPTLALSFSLVAALWSAGKGASAIRRGFAAVYEREEKSYLRSRLRGSADVLLLLLFFTLSAGLSMVGEWLRELVSSWFPQMPAVLFYILDLRFLMVFFALSAAFTAIYRGAADDAKFFRHAPAALLAAVAWILFTAGFSLYLSVNESMTALYGSLTTLVVLLLWMYVCVRILFLGAELDRLLCRRKR